MSELRIRIAAQLTKDEVPGSSAKSLFIRNVLSTRTFALYFNIILTVTKWQTQRMGGHIM